MRLLKYDALTDARHETYEFLSSGPKGTIKKVVKYTEIEPGVFNLGFGDWNEREQKINDNIRTNNADKDRVLATVASTVTDFMQHHPGASPVCRKRNHCKNEAISNGDQRKLG